MEVKFVQETCCSDGCGIVFLLEEKYQTRLISTKRTFYCPNGHAQNYQGESDRVKAIRLANEKASLERQKNSEIEELERKLKRKCRSKKSK